MGSPRLAVVWGNCQAAPLADLLRGPLAACGFEVVDVAPVYLAERSEIAEVHRIVREAAFLVSQPIREEYRFGGCGTESLAAELPPGGRLVRIPTTFHVGPFPWLVNAHGADGARVDAPIVDYHDLRAVVAASRGLDPGRAAAWWPAPDAEAVRAIDAESVRRLRDREAGLDVAVSDLVTAPDALWSMNHPSNRVLAAISGRILAAVGLPPAVDVPDREYLGQRRAPVDVAVADALGWPVSAARPDWVVDGIALDGADVLAAQLEFYARRPDVVTDTLRRYADRLGQLGLTDQPSASARRSAPVSSS